jgi:hypothetical protein
MICPDDRSKRYIYRYIQKTLEYAEDMDFYLSTWELVKIKGFRRDILIKVEGDD